MCQHFVNIPLALLLRVLKYAAIRIYGLLFGLTDAFIYNNVLICERHQNSCYLFFVTCLVMMRNFPTGDFSQAVAHSL